jgi:hypothetical protein
MGTRPDHTVRTASRRFLVLAALTLCVALVDVPGASAARANVDSATGSATATGPTGPVTKSGSGSVTQKGKRYVICVPYFAIGIPHTFEIKDGDTVVDSFTYTVPPENGKVETLKTAENIKIKITTDHTVGVNGSPSKGCFTYKPPRL